MDIHYSDCAAISDSNSLIKRLSESTGLTFKLDDSTGGPAASGAALNYWVTEYQEKFYLEANSIYDQVFSESIGTEEQLVDKINELENDLRHVY